MGLLEDAIREHLELKRRTGADPGDVARLEREALSPATREAAPAAPVEAEVPSADIEETLAASPFDDADAALAPDPGAPFDFEFDASPHAAEDAAVAAVEPEAEVEPEAIAREPDVQTAAEAASAEATAVLPPAPDLPEPPPPAEPPVASQETAAFEAEDIFADEPEAAEPPTQGEDVLEETPEFLAETPDHDRLWFEQKPPRDFDF